MTDLYWFRNDLRLDDNPALAQHAGGRKLLCVYVWPRHLPWCNVNGLGKQRERFLLESLASLQQDLRARGQELLVLRDPPEECLPRLVREFGVTLVGVAQTAGEHERREVAQLGRMLGVPLKQHGGNTLFEGSQVTDRFKALPRQYTPFRQEVENLPPVQAITIPALPPPPRGLQAPEVKLPDTGPHPAFVARGGEAAGQLRLHTWMFRERGIDHYDQTRNELEGLFFSSGLSPWLANGALSVRRLATELAKYEEQYGASNATKHFHRELLWREFFHWRALEDGAALFRQGGRDNRKCHFCTFDPRQFARWCNGSTDYPLVNALMHQLLETGWMSNRGRQIAASCLVNELGLDWRFGAAFFEKHLLDHDVALNYGNWQYLAGVGSDPRGGRHFNLAKQEAHYDPEGRFIARWRGKCAPQPEYVTDAADWPINVG